MLSRSVGRDDDLLGDRIAGHDALDALDELVPGHGLPSAKLMARLSTMAAAVPLPTTGPCRRESWPDREPCGITGCRRLTAAEVAVAVANRVLAHPELQVVNKSQEACMLPSVYVPPAPWVNGVDDGMHRMRPPSAVWKVQSSLRAESWNPVSSREPPP